MKNFKVTITETLEKVVNIKANSREEALEIAEKGWKDGNFVLDADNFTGVEYSAKELKSRNMER